VIGRTDPASRLPGPTGLSRLRYLKGLMGDPYDALLDLERRYGPVVKFGFAGQHYVIIFGAEANRLLLADSPTNPKFLSREVLGLLIPVVGSCAMVVSDRDDHRRRRSLVQPAFAKKRIAIRSLFGNRLKTHTDEIGAELETALRYINRSPFLRFDHDLPGTAFRRAMAARAQVDALARAEIEKRRAEPEDQGDVLDALLFSCGHAGDQLDDLEVRDQVISLIASGYDSSSSAAGWAIYALLTHPEVLARIAAEVREVAGDAPLTLGGLEKMHYLSWTVSEILRLYTPGVLTGRTAVEDFEYACHVIPAGTKVLYSQYVTHRLPELWTDPLAMRPERWDPDAPGYREPEPYSFIPFGGGYRKCIGFTFAELELEVLIAEVARRTELTTVGDPVQPQGVATMWPKGGVPVAVQAVRPEAASPNLR
jgi:cytochrome P450